MAKNTVNIHSYGDLLQGVWTAPIGSTLPPQGTAWTPGVWPTGWSEVGWVSDGGVTDNETFNETIKYGWQGGAEVRRLRNQAAKTVEFEALEENATVLGLLRPNATVTTTGAVAEVQTVTISGTPTGGTFPLTLPGYGTYTAAYNVSTAALQTALQTAFGIATIGVTGTAGTSYVVNFGAGAGNVPTMVTNGASLTGGASPNASVATTTPGVNGLNSRPLLPYISRNLRYFGVDLVDGGVWKREVYTNAEAKRNGSQAYKADDDTVYPFQIVCYLDSTGAWGYELDNNTALASGLFT